MQYTRDFRGNVKTRTDRANRVTHYQYDFAGQLRSVTYAEGTPDAATVSYNDDVTGRRISETDELDKTTTYEYDDADRLKRILRRFGLFGQFSRVTE